MQEGRVNFKCWTAKNVTFNEFYYIAFTHTRETRAKLFGQDDGAVFLEILVDVNEKQLKIVLHCIFENNTKKNRTKKFATFESIALRRETENTQKKNNIKTISIGVMSEYKQVDKVIFFYINMFSVINERKEIKL